jgi:LPXTG-site transpeptidase (sortase) family protein
MNPKTSRPIVRRALNLVILLGVLVALSPAFKHAYGWWSQRQLLAQWDASAQKPSDKAPAPKSSPKAAARITQKPKQAARANEKASPASAITMSAQSGDESESVPLPPTRLSIPEIDVDAIVVQGLGEDSLAQGPGHDPRSALPGQEGNCVIAAHRNVYGSWFYKLDQLWSGSVVELKSEGQSYRYTIVGVRTVSEADNSVLWPISGMPPSLTLITCTLPHSPFRLVATGYLQNS